MIFLYFVLWMYTLYYIRSSEVPSYVYMSSRRSILEMQLAN